MPPRVESFPWAFLFWIIPNVVLWVWRLPRIILLPLFAVFALFEMESPAHNCDLEKGLFIIARRRVMSFQMPPLVQPYVTGPRLHALFLMKAFAAAR